MEKQTFLITSYIPPDENIVVSDIYKLQKLGYKDNITWIFIAITYNGGYGTGIDNFGHKTELEAIKSLISMGAFDTIEKELYKFGDMTLDEALEIRKQQVEFLTQELK